MIKSWLVQQDLLGVISLVFIAVRPALYPKYQVKNARSDNAIMLDTIFTCIYYSEIGLGISRALFLAYIYQCTVIVSLTR